MKINTEFFGTTKKDQKVNKYTLINDLGAYVSIIELGCIISEINVLDSNGNIENVVFGFNNVKDYEEKSQFFGTVVGRTAGRTSNGKFIIDSKEYTLSQNDGTNNLHGGPDGFETEVFDVIDKKITSNECSIKMKLLHPDGKCGFPGNLTTIVTYTWDNNNQLNMELKARTDKDTIVNLTNHSYFNLSGDLSSDIHDHLLYMDADYFLDYDENTNYRGFIDVNNTPFDFTKEKKVGKDINSKYSPLIEKGGYDHPFKLNNPGLDNTQIILKDPKTKRKLEISTNNEACVFYAGNQLKPGMKIYDSIPIKKRGALCLETQYFPNDINSDLIKTKSILRKGETYNKTTIYKFSTY